MIDRDLIDQNASRVIAAIKNRITTDINGLYKISNLLDDVILNKLDNYIKDSTHAQWSTVPGQERKSRRKIDWDPDTVIEELHEVFSQSTDIVNEVFPGLHKHFWGISLWADPPGYEFDWHTDNPDIDVSMQIYLYDSGNNGTVFRHNSNDVLVSGDHNSGYLILQTGDDKIPHCTERTVVEGITRYSLYVVWSRFPKHFSNS